MDKSGTLYFAI